MGTITRSTKAGSTTEFAESFALGNTLQVADLDTDLDAIVTEFNGGIDDSNVVAGAAIAYSKLNLAASIVDADIVAMAGSKLTAASVAIAKLANGAATANYFYGATDDTATPATISTTATVLLEGTPTGVRTGTILVVGVVSGFFDLTASGGGSFVDFVSETVDASIYEGGTASTVDGTQRGKTRGLFQKITYTNGDDIPFTLVTVHLSNAAAPAARYKLVVKATHNGAGAGASACTVKKVSSALFGLQLA